MVAIPGLDYKQAGKAISALKEYVSRDSDDSLLGESDRAMWLQIKLAKMSTGNQKRHDSLTLPHCILAEDDEICLLVIDRATEFQQKIDELKFERKITVLTAKAFREKYTRFEARRQVARQFGLFLVDASLANKINSLFGESFKKVNKAPGIVRLSQDRKMLDDEQLKENLSNAINSIVINKNASDLKTAKFGRAEMSEKELLDNFKVVFTNLKNTLEWEFVQSVSVFSDNTVVLPVYACVPGVWLLEDEVMEEAAPKVTPKQEESLKKAAKMTKKTKKAEVEPKETAAPAKKSKAAPKKDEDAALKAKTQKSITKKPVAKGKKSKAAK